MYYMVEGSNNSHFSHVAFVATFDPKDIGHMLSNHNWVNSMHEDLENCERNQVREFVDPPQGVSRLGQNACGRTKRERKVKW
jgi:hypothetical protein